MIRLGLVLTLAFSPDLRSNRSRAIFKPTICGPFTCICGGDVWGVDSQVRPACCIYSGADKDHCLGRGGIFSVFCDGIDYFPSGWSTDLIKHRVD
jgi:hypothetical protein